MLNASGNEAMMVTEVRGEILRMLCRDVRLLATAHLATHWFSGLKNPRERANREARELAAAGFVNKAETSLALIDVSTPLYVWKPGSDKPNFSRLAAANDKRWKEPLRRTQTLTATKKAYELYGGYQRKAVRTRELEHDAAIATLRFQMADQLQAWTIEDGLPQAEAGQKRPDAVVQTDGKTILLEMVGRRYSADKLEQLWRAYRNQDFQFR